MDTEVEEAASRVRSARRSKADHADQVTQKAVARGTSSKPAPGISISPSSTHSNILKDLTRFAEVYTAEPSVRIVTIKHGVRADAFNRIARSMDRSKEQLGKTLGLSVTTVDRKAKAGEPLSAEQSERLVGIARLIGQVQTMVEQSGNPEGFDAARWLGRWLDEPLPALGGERPADLMDTAEGRGLVSNLLAMAQSGAYA
ncbi:putative toxin-antitoxin system antitoxin component (TIGR02293 family) [Paraburkholderia sp. BL8N3]|nr:antitoxin Xre-like helix-turn-helix domain-containing protein [Paraburkholderia sp. BL8N3]TCK33303.1 putative toxin-antitoxin system antitoxin component (TIGR02293 family) [Paraburkholderia sp. BL8N3]